MPVLIRPRLAGFEVTGDIVNEVFSGRRLFTQTLRFLGGWSIWNFWFEQFIQLVPLLSIARARGAVAEWIRLLRSNVADLENEKIDLGLISMANNGVLIRLAERLPGKALGLLSLSPYRTGGRSEGCAGLTNPSEAVESCARTIGTGVMLLNARCHRTNSACVSDFAVVLTNRKSLSPGNERLSRSSGTMERTISLFCGVIGVPDFVRPSWNNR